MHTTLISLSFSRIEFCMSHQDSLRHELDLGLVPVETLVQADAVADSVTKR